LIRLQTSLSEQLYSSLFACRNQQSLKLYTGFFVPVNKNLTFCLPADHFACLGKFFDLPRDLQRFQRALRLLTVISRALDSIPVFSSQSKQIQKICFFSRPLSAG
jgi:hypothetical protein